MLKGKFWTRHVYDADDGAGGSGDVNAGDGGGSAAGSGGGRDGAPPTLEDAQKLISALQKRVSDRDEALDTLKGRLSALENAQKKALEQTGNYEQLYKEAQSQLEALRPKVEGYEKLDAVIRAANKAMIESIPEGMRSLVPDLAPDALNQWLQKNRAMLTRTPAPDIDAGVGAGGAGGGSVALTDEQKRMAKRMRMTEAEYAEQLKKISGRDA